MKQIPAQYPQVKLLAHPVKTGQARQGLPGNVDIITGSAFLPAPAYRQEGGASSRLAREILTTSVTGWEREVHGE
jgi:hypothetical protein